MAFTPEDGSQVVGANAYATAAQVTEYLTDRGREAENGWNALASAAQEVAIIKATDYIEKRWGPRFRGTRKGADAVQGLEWPREGAYDDDGFAYPNDEIPRRLIQAVAEYAVRAASAELLQDPGAIGEAIDRDIRRKTEKVGPLEDTTEYFGNEVAVSALLPDVTPYPAADLLLRELVTGDPLGQNTIQFARVMRA